jgi:hypothetical protein
MLLERDRSATIGKVQRMRLRQHEADRAVFTQALRKARPLEG